MLQVLLLFTASLLSYFLNKVLIKYSNRIGSMANGEAQKVQQIRWASHSKPLVGGVSFFIIFLLASVCLSLLPGFMPDWQLSSPNDSFLPLVVAATIGFLVGLADDAYTTKPFLKFIGQLACAVTLIAFNIHIRLFDIAALDYLLTILWVVGIMNSINMLDNMDGVTGSVSMGILLSAFALMQTMGKDLGVYSPSMYWMTLTLIGALAGFLYLNWNPSKLFMGDTGSQFLGAVLAFYGIQYFWNLPTQSGQIIFSRNLLIPILAFLMPIMDTTFVTIARLSRGQSPFVGGRDHITHHLFYFGLHDRVIPIVTLSVTALSGMLILAIVKVIANGWSHVETALFAGYIALMFGVFAYIYRTAARLNRLKKEAQEAENRAMAVVPEQERVLEPVGR